MSESAGRGGSGRLAHQLATVGHLGMMFPVSIGLGALAGYLLDRHFDTLPGFTLAGFALGVAAAVRELLRTGAQLEREQTRDAAGAPRGADLLRQEEQREETDERPAGAGGRDDRAARRDG